MKDRHFTFSGNRQWAEEIAKNLVEEYFAQKPSAKTGARDDIIVSFTTPKKFKTNKQNALFHSLLTVYFESGMSSYRDYDDMRSHFKKIAGLVSEYSETVSQSLPLTMEQKRIVFAYITKACKIAGVSEHVQNEMFSRLRGDTHYVHKNERSWADVSKDGARRTLDCLINEMIEAGVNSDKFEQIMKSLDDNSYWNTETYVEK